MHIVRIFMHVYRLVLLQEQRAQHSDNSMAACFDSIAGTSAYTYYLFAYIIICSHICEHIHVIYVWISAAYIDTFHSHIRTKSTFIIIFFGNILPYGAVFAQYLLCSCIYGIRC